MIQRFRRGEMVIDDCRIRLMDHKKSVHIYPTLRCNGKCSYCSNVVPTTKEKYSYQEKLPGHWIKLIRNIEDWEMYFTGGEVFLFLGFRDILESIPRYARIYTNTMMLDNNLLGNADPACLFFRCSYHPSIGSVDRFMEGLEILKQREISFQLYMVDTPRNEVLVFKTEIFRKRDYEIGIDYDQNRHGHKKGKVKCFIPSIFISPDGSIFNCVSRMLRNKNAMGNAFSDYTLGVEAETVICDEPDACSPCDLAASYQEIVE